MKHYLERAVTLTAWNLLKPITNIADRPFLLLQGEDNVYALYEYGYVDIPNTELGELDIAKLPGYGEVYLDVGDDIRVFKVKVGSYMNEGASYAPFNKPGGSSFHIEEGN